MRHLCNLGKLQFKRKKTRIFIFHWLLYSLLFFTLSRRQKNKSKLDFLQYSLFKHFNIHCLAVQRTDNDVDLSFLQKLIICVHVSESTEHRKSWLWCEELGTSVHPSPPGAAPAPAPARSGGPRLSAAH